jgi:hypothetical protein
VPIVFDFHHHPFCPGGLTEEEALRAAVATWPPGVKPVVHWRVAASPPAATPLPAACSRAASPLAAPLAALPFRCPPPTAALPIR